MRAVTLRLGLSKLLFLSSIAVSLTLAPASMVAAQFEDEFDDEFDDEPESSDDTSSDDAAPSGGGDDEFDEFDDDFEEDLEDAESEPGLDDDDEFGDLDDETPPEDEEEEEEGDEELRERLFATTFNSYFGPTGGLHVVDAGGGAVGSFRVQLQTDFFFASDFINEGDDADHVGGSLSLAWTVHEMVEIWASIQSYANANDTGDPGLFQVLGDTQLGVKAFYRISDVLTIGGDFTLALLNTVGDIGLVFKSTSFGLRANLAADLRGLPSSVPFIARFNAQYFFDNSEKLISDVETQRYANLEDPMPDVSEEHRHLLTTVERFALNINRTDFFNLALGFELPLEISDGFHLHPLLEWSWAIPVNRQGYSCLFRPAEPGGSDPVEGDDGCLDKQGAGSFPMNLTLGARIAPPVEGLSFLLAADVGLTGKSVFVRELAPNAPYNLYLGLSYAYDTVREPAEPIVREVERRVEVSLPPPLEGRIRGTVVEQGANSPVAGATIAFPGRELTSLVSGNDGVFTTYRLEPGEVQLAVSHPEYNDGTCSGTIPDERPEEGELVVEIRCELVALPRVGGLNARVMSDAGAPVPGATVQLTGPARRNLTAGPDGSVTVNDLPPGTYQVRVDADEYLIKLQEVEVAARETATPTITLVSRPARALARVTRREIQIRRKINFATDSAEILPSSEPLLTEIADVLIRNPDIQLIEVQGHTDNRGAAARNQTLSQERADSVRNWLIAHGVQGTRLTARGYGASQPRVPNITPANRARNRRVQFVIQSRATE